MATLHSRAGSASRSGTMTAAMTAMGQSVGHTAVRNASATVRPTRRHAAGQRTKIDVKATGSSVPKAWPTRPNRRIHHRLSTTFASAAPAFENASIRCCPAPFSSVVAVALPTRMATTPIRICATITLPSKRGPTHA